MQDGAPAHRLITVHDRLSELFGHRVIALYEDVVWPPRSADVTPCDFFLSPNDLNDLKNRIQDEVDVLRNDLTLIRRKFHVKRGRCGLCIERGGEHVKEIGV